MYVNGGIRADHVSGGGSRIADSAEAAKADARKTLLALTCLSLAFFLTGTSLRITNFSFADYTVPATSSKQ